MKDDERDWEYSIERILHNFALRLVVPEKYYKQVNEYVNGHNPVSYTHLFGKYIFALKENTGTEPMELTIEFETKTGIPYIYSVEIMNTGIVSEILQISGLGSEENHNVFTRKEGKIE